MVKYTENIQSEIILDTTTTVVDEPIVYPDGQARIISVKITVPPGVETGWHTHEAPIYGYILEGVLEIEYKDKGKKQYKAGESLVEALNIIHNGKAVGDMPVKLIAVLFSSAVGTKPTMIVK